MPPLMFSAKYTSMAASMGLQCLAAPKTQKPTILLIHGGWQSPSVWTQLVSLLELAGYSSFTPSLPSSGTIPAVPDLSADVNVVKNAIESILESGKDVVVVMHSYGAVVGCEALTAFTNDQEDAIMSDLAVKGEDRIGAVGTEDIETQENELASQVSLPPRATSGRTLQTPGHDLGLPPRGRILHLAFITAMILPPGSSLWKATRGTIPGFTCEEDLIRITDGPTRLYSDLSPALAEKWAAKLKPQSRLAFISPTSKSTIPTLQSFAKSYLLCTRDQAIPPAHQAQMAQMAGIESDCVWKIDAGHSPMISQPGVVARFVRRAAGEVNCLL